MSRKNALKPLEDRMNKQQLDRREMKIQARKLVAAQLMGQVNLVGQYMVSFVYRGFFARFKWLIFGEPRVDKGE